HAAAPRAEGEGCTHYPSHPLARSSLDGAPKHAGPQSVCLDLGTARTLDAIELRRSFCLWNPCPSWECSGGLEFRVTGFVHHGYGAPDRAARSDPLNLGRRACHDTIISRDAPLARAIRRTFHLLCRLLGVGREGRRDSRDDEVRRGAGRVRTGT